MKKRRIILGALLASAAIAGLASCGNNENNGETTTTPVVTTSGNTTTPDTGSTTTPDTGSTTTPDTGSTTTPGTTVTDPVTTDTETTGETTGDEQLDPKYDKYIKIDSVEKFNEFREGTNPDYPADGKYVLTKDIDLEGVELNATNFSLVDGVFDGNGHTIKNASYTTNAANKTGILLREFNGGTVTNVKFLNCNAIYNGETIGIISGMSSGEINISKVEFNACTASANNYMGMLTGRISSSGTKLLAEEITTKNGCRTKATSYGGFLMGDIAGGSSATDQNVIKFSNMDLAGEFVGGNLNGSFVFGRIRNNTSVTLENSVIRDAQLTNSAVGLLAGGGTTNGKNTNVNIKNVAILNTNAGTLQSLGDLMKADSLASGEFLTTYDLQNVYIPNGSTVSLGTAMPQTPTHNEVTALTDAVTPDWLKNNVKLDFDTTWMTEGENNDKYRLVASSTNVKSKDAKLVSLKATTSNTPTRFTKGTEFSADGLVITATYSDGVQLIIGSSEYTIDSSKFNSEAAGVYTITVKGNELNEAGAEVTVSYDVTLAEQTGFDIDTQFTKLVYVKGEELKLDNLLVYSKWSDGVKSKEDAKSYITDSAAFNKDAAGSYDINISMTGFTAQPVKVSVVNSKPVAVDGNIYVNVDAKATVAYEGAKVNGVETFTTLTNAIDYLAAANLGDVNKVVFVADGTYHEKITVPSTVTNLKLIGQSQDKTIIDYDAVEGTLNPLNGQVYKMDCATIHVNATGFGLENITVQNSFDYINESSNYGDPQGFALTINADGAVLNNVHLYGNQDTLFFKSGRTYLVNSIIEGNVDFIFGENNGLAFFEQCLINAVYRGNTTNTGYVTAMKGDTGATKPSYGYIFNACAFTADGDYKEGTVPTSGPATMYNKTHNFNGTYDVQDESMSLGRPWGGGATIAMINCSFTAAYSKKAYTTDDKTKSRWFSMSGNLPTNADFCEYGSTGDGAITEAVNGGKLLTGEQAANYTADNLFAAQNGGVKYTSAFDYKAALTAIEGMASKTAGTSIEVASETVTVFEGGSFDLKPFIKPWNADNKEITAVVGTANSISYTDGIITGITAGTTTTLTLTCGSLTKVINVEVATGTYYQVDFVTDGSAVASQNVLSGEKIEAVETTLAHAKFVGWYTDEAFTNEFDVNTPISGAITLYARFVSLLTYNYNNQGDAVLDATSADQTVTKPAQYHTTVGGDNNVKEGDDYVAVPLIAASGYMQFNISGYTKNVSVELIGSTTGTSKDVTISASAYNEKGEVIKTVEFVLCTAKLTTKNSFAIDATENISYVRINNTYSKAIAIISAEVTYDKVTTAEKSYSIQFGAEGNYADYIDTSKATVSDHASEPTSQVVGDIELNVKAGGTVVVTGYPGYYDYSIKVGSADAVAATKEYSYVTVTEDTVVTITSAKYLYSIEVIYPITTNTSFLYADGTLKTGNGLSFSYVAGKTVNDNGEAYNFKSATYTAPVFTVARACTVTVVGHSQGYGLVDIYINGVLQTVEIAADGTYTFEAKANDVFEIACSSVDRSKSYLKGVTISFE